ncbi:MAG: IS110 family transposase [Anaerolineae bacterium]|jgi:transposase
MTQEEQPFTRFVGVDLHKRFVVIAAVDAQQNVVLTPRRVSLKQLPVWAAKHLRPTDAVALETTSNAWTTHDILAPLVGRCVVANSLQVKWIAAAAVKTDKQDALRLAKLLAANLIPEVWVPPVPVRELRALIAHRRQIVKQQTRLKNQLHAVLHRNHLDTPPGDPFAAHNRDWWRGLDLSPTESLRLQQDLDSLIHVQQQLADVMTELHRLSTQDPWTDQAPFLVQLPGFGLLTTMTVLSAIGDVTRFPCAKKLVGYAGLGAGVHSSGETHRGKGITKRGRRELRRVLIEAAWVAAQKSPYWKEQFRRLTRHKHHNVAIVAIARKLLVAVWHVLTERAADRHAEPQMVAFKLMIWSWKLSPQDRQGMTSRQFVRYGLLQLDLGHDLDCLITGRSTKRAIAPAEEVLALFPELRPA